MKNNWKVKGPYWQPGMFSNDRLEDNLENGIYDIKELPTGELILQKVGEKFEFNYKIYGLETNLIDHISRTHGSFNRNLGILLYGVKGTGKSVSAKIIANRINKPIILVNRAYKGLPDLLFAIKQEVTVFIDEFEKVVSADDSSLLTVMDGAYDNGYKKTFILTANNRTVNNYLINRPGRLRYIQYFGNLEYSTVCEIVDDFLIHKQYRQELLETIAMMNLITVDLVKALIEEVNIHNMSPKDFLKFFNMELDVPDYRVYNVTDFPDRESEKLNETTMLTQTISAARVLKGYDPIYDLGSFEEIIEEEDGTMLVKAWKHHTKFDGMPNSLYPNTMTDVVGENIGNKYVLLRLVKVKGKNADFEQHLDPNYINRPNGTKTLPRAGNKDVALIPAPEWKSRTYDDLPYEEKKRVAKMLGKEEPTKPTKKGGKKEKGEVLELDEDFDTAEDTSSAKVVRSRH